MASEAELKSFQLAAKDDPKSALELKELFAGPKALGPPKASRTKADNLVTKMNRLTIGKRQMDMSGLGASLDDIASDDEKKQKGEDALSRQMGGLSLNTAQKYGVLHLPLDDFMIYLDKMTEGGDLLLLFKYNFDEKVDKLIGTWISMNDQARKMPLFFPYKGGKFMLRRLQKAYDRFQKIVFWSNDERTKWVVNIDDSEKWKTHFDMWNDTIDNIVDVLRKKYSDVPKTPVKELRFKHVESGVRGLVITDQKGRSAATTGLYLENDLFRRKDMTLYAILDRYDEIASQMPSRVGKKFNVVDLTMKF